MRKIGGRNMDKFGMLDGGEKTIAILGDGWWPQTAKQEGDKKYKKLVVMYRRKVLSAQVVESISISRNGAPSRKKWSNGLRQATNERATPYRSRRPRRAPSTRDAPIVLSRRNIS